MNLRFSASSRRCGRSLFVLTTAALSCLFGAAQTKTDPVAATTKPPEVTQTVFLAHMTDSHDLVEVENDLRNMLPRARVYADFSAQAISMQGSQDDLALAQKLVAELDRPHLIYRLTYTITTTEPGKPPSTQRFSFIVSPGEKTILKQGSRVPILTGANREQSALTSQVQYLDVGLNIDAMVEGSPDDLRLRTKVEQSSLTDERSGIGVPDPVIRQTDFQTDVLLSQNKPLSIGSLDIPGSTRHQEVAVIAELVHSAP